MTSILPARATLVVAVPSAEGLVVAADSRESILGTECDGLFKIAVPRNPSRTAVVVTGDAVFVPPPGNAPGLCAYLETAPRLLDVAAVVTHYLEQRQAPFAQLRTEELAAACVAAVEHFRHSHPEALEIYKGRDIFSVVIAHYDPKPRVSTLLNFVVRMDEATGEIRFGRTARTVIRPTDRRGVWAFGETDYLAGNVYRGAGRQYLGAGRQYLGAATRRFILEDRSVMEVKPDEAVAVAIDVIRAASRTAETVPPPSGIGGPIQAVLLGAGQHPKEISSP